MEDVFRFADELGPSKIIRIYNPSVEMKTTPDVDDDCLPDHCNPWCNRWSFSGKKGCSN